MLGLLQSALLKKAEDTEADTAEMSATKIRLQQQSSMALVVANPQPANGGLHLPSIPKGATPGKTPPFLEQAVHFVLKQVLACSGGLRVCTYGMNDD
jgi:hypothetical protein